MGTLAYEGFLDNGIFDHPLLTSEEERTLLEEAVGDRLKGFDGQARETLVLHNLRLAARMASKFQGRGMDLDDLVSEAILGLFEGIDHFDTHYQNRFSTYASWWISQRLHRAVTRQGRTVRLPDNIARNLRRLKILYARTQNRYGRKPKPHEVLRHLKCNGRWGKLMIRLLEQRISSLDDHPEGTDGNYQHEVTDTRHPLAEEVASGREIGEQVRGLLLCLPERDQQVLSLRYGLNGDKPKTLNEVGRQYGLCRERVRQIERRALQKLAKRAEGKTQLLEAAGCL